MNVTLMLAASAATVVALLARLRRSRGGERQQLKWLCYAGALTVSGNSGSVPHLISRTVVYGLLTALVTAVYLAIVCVRMSHVPSDADALIAYQQQLATSAAELNGFRHTTSIIGTCWVCFPTKSPVQVRRPDLH
jgi:hypothetical protein